MQNIFFCKKIWKEKRTNKTVPHFQVCHPFVNVHLSSSLFRKCKDCIFLRSGYMQFVNVVASWARPIAKQLYSLYCGGGNPGLNLGKGWQTLMNSYYLCQINKEIKGHLMPLHKKVNSYQTYTFSYYLLYLNQFLPSENNARKNV